MKKFHVTENGPGECKAEVRKCKYAHFNAMELAEKHFAESKNLFVSHKRSDKSFLAKTKPLKGASYFGAEVDFSAVENHLKEWKQIVGEEQFQLMEGKRIERDQGKKHHITVINPKETRQLKKNNPGVHIEVPEFKFETVGIGTATSASGENTAWFIVCKSDEADQWRKKMGLGEKDFHITLGFNNKDVHDVFKDENTLFNK